MNQLIRDELIKERMASLINVLVVCLFLTMFNYVELLSYILNFKLHLNTILPLQCNKLDWFLNMAL